MQLAAVVLARTLAYIETFDLSPRGNVFLPDVVKAMVERYRFRKFPTKPEEFDESNGVVFEDGKAGNKVIQKFTIFTTLLVVETRSNTDDSKQVIEDMLLWGAAKFGIAYRTGAADVPRG